jgi:hypothetical protein
MEIFSNLELSGLWALIFVWGVGKFFTLFVTPAKNFSPFTLASDMGNWQSNDRNFPIPHQEVSFEPPQTMQKTKETDRNVRFEPYLSKQD